MREDEWTSMMSEDEWTLMMSEDEWTLIMREDGWKDECYMDARNRRSANIEARHGQQHAAGFGWLDPGSDPSSSHHFERANYHTPPTKV
jgi:hypothetical protein